MNAHPFPVSVQQIVAKLGGQVTGRDTCNVPGPGHTAKDTSLSIKIDPTAPDGFLVYSHAGDDDIACKDWVREQLGLPSWKASRKSEKASNVNDEYIYRQADGTPYLKVCRTRDKGFFQQRWDGGTWLKGAPKGPKIPYRLPELLNAEHDDVFVAEGEKDCNNLAMRGFTATTNSGGAGKWTSDLNAHFAEKDVYILPDNDDVGAKHGRMVAADLLTVARTVRIVNLPDLPPKGDVSDWFSAGGTPDQLADLGRQAKPITADELALDDERAVGKQPKSSSDRASAEDSGAGDETNWRDQLIYSKNGTLRAVLANAITALRGAACWNGVLTFNEFAYSIMLRSAPPWERSTESSAFQARVWSEQDDIAATNWLQTIEGITVTPAVTAQAVELVARDHTHHPVREYLRRSEWDGTARIDGLLSTYFSAEQSAYTEAVSRITMISAIARIFDPGCQVDTLLIIEGPQGLMKSTAIKALFAPWFTDEIEQLGTKDASMQVAGVWGIEISELDAMSRAEVSKIKAFISRRVDRFRPPYGRRVIERPRDCIFIGSTNTNDYLKDATGARRFLPVTVSKIDIEALRRDRDQLWAEARALYERGTPWWFTDQHHDAAAAAKDEQEARYQVDPWEQLIADYLESRIHQPPDWPAYRVTVERVFKDALSIGDALRWDQTAMNRIARCLKRLGWKKKQVRVTVTVQGKPESKPRWFYVREPTADELKQDAAATKKESTAGDANGEQRNQSGADVIELYAGLGAGAKAK